MTGWAAHSEHVGAMVDGGERGLDALATLDAGVAIEYAKERLGPGKSGHTPLSVESRCASSLAGDE